MSLPPLSRLDPHTLRTASTDAPPYEGATWTLEFTEEGVQGPVGPRMCIEIRLMNRAQGYADAGDGRQHRLTKALTKKFLPVFKSDADFEWVAAKRGEWNVLCSDHTQSYGYWKFYTDLNSAEALGKARDGRVSLIPGGTTLGFLRQAFGGLGIVRVIELDGKDYQFDQPEGVPRNEGSFVVWKLGEPGGVTDFVRRRIFGGEPGREQ